jgi:aminocarboxymuconate-semialdehyde decarboxylase
MQPLLSDVSKRFESMAERRVDAQVLSPAMTVIDYRMEARHAQALARLFNDTNAAFAGKSEGRLIPVATLPMQSIQAAIEELDYAVKTLGIRMVEIGTNINGANLDETIFDPFFARAADLDVLVQLHPKHPDQVVGSERLRRYYLTNFLGNPMDTAIAAASLIFGGVLERYPTLNVCLVHGGGAFPYLAGRVSFGYATVKVSRTISKPPETYFRRFYFDTVVHEPRSLAFLSNLVGSDRLMLGTDYPYAMGEADPLGELDRAGIGPDTGIIGGTAGRLLGRQISERPTTS